MSANSSIFRIIFLLLLLAVVFFEKSRAQKVSLSIKQALQKVQANLPQLEVYRQQALATQQNMHLAKNTLVPDLNMGYQLNLATYNNITGMSYPGFLLPISGPPSISNDLNFVPGSAAGALIKWTPFTFGQRSAAVEKATAEFKHANAVYNEQLFQYQYSVINIYLDALYYKELLKSLQGVIDRNNIGLEQSLVLAKTGLRPGIDTAQFQAAIAQSEVDLLQTERIYQQQLTELSRLTAIGSSSEDIILADTIFVEPVSFIDDTVYHASAHPLYQTLLAQKNTTVAGLKEIQNTWAPQLDIWANMYGRGSGVQASGQLNKSDGFNLSRTNAGIGLQLSFPVLQFAKMNIKKKQYQFLLKADEASLSQAELDLKKQVTTALQQYYQDQKIAAKSPVLLKSVTNVYEGLKLSYETGLIDYTRLSQAQYDLLKAEVNNANAHLQLWKSLLAIAAAKGQLNLFTDQFK